MSWEQVKNNTWFDSQRLITCENGNNLDYLPKKKMFIIFFFITVLRCVDVYQVI